jgi:hypothetical protein
VVLVGRRGFLAAGGQDLVDLNLAAPHRDLLFGTGQPDQLVQLGLSGGQRRLLLGDQRGRGALIGAGLRCRPLSSVMYASRRRMVQPGEVEVSQTGKASHARGMGEGI